MMLSTTSLKNQIPSNLLLVVCSTLLLLAGAKAEETPKFYAFRNGVNFGDAENEAKTLKDLGYAGINQVFKTGEPLADRIKAYEAKSLKVLSVYLDVSDKPVAAEKVAQFKDKDAMIELTIKKMTPQTVEAVKKTAEMAKGMNMKVALYPHHGFAIATMPQAMEMIKKVDHPNLGVMFNLCHFLKNEDVKSLETTLEKAGDRLFAVSVSGADLGGKNWQQLIKPLDQGTFPQERLVKQLKKMKFTGPVGLQCYNVKGDKKENLAASMKKWKALW
jgi:hypothetical protein